MKKQILSTVLTTLISSTALAEEQHLYTFQ